MLLCYMLLCYMLLCYMLRTAASCSWLAPHAAPGISLQQ